LVPAIMQLLGDKAWWLPKWLDRILPRLDVEGEGLAHEVALRDWPEPNSDYRVYGRGIGVYSGSRGFARVDISLLPGQILVASGAARRALLLAVSGRVGLSAGEMKIGQNVLPEHAGRVRRQVPYFDLAGERSRPGGQPARHLTDGRLGAGSARHRRGGEPRGRGTGIGRTGTRPARVCLPAARRRRAPPSSSACPTAT
jgi:hypothetical protein